MFSDSPFSESLAQLEVNGLLRDLPVETDRTGPRILRGGQELLGFCSNDYLGLSNHPDLIRAACDATSRFGCGATGSRLLSGNLSLHAQLEEKIADFKGAGSALLLNSGFSANLAILGALAQPGDRIVCDKLNHASLHDGARASGAEARFYRHGDLARAKELLLSAPTGAKKFLVTDGVFSMDGDIARLPELVAIAREASAILVVDEAHATGVLGRSGRGTFEHFGLNPDARSLGIPALVVMGTFGKALGGFGAYALTDPMTRKFLINRARPFIYSTALPPSVVGAAIAAFEVIEREPERREKLRSNSAYLRARLRDSGFEIPADPTPIIPVLIGDAEQALHFSRGLLDEGIVALAVRPPTVPVGTSRIRVSVRADHETRDLDFCADAFARVRGRIGAQR